MRLIPNAKQYRDEEELLAKQSDPQKYNDEVIFPDKVHLNLYYLHTILSQKTYK